MMPRMSPPRLMSSNTDPLLNDSFKCRKSETVHAAPLPAPATSEKSDIYYGKETDKCLKNSSTHVAQVSGFLTFFCSPFFFFVNKVVLSKACLYELCWIERESMRLAYHGNLCLLKKSPQVPCVLITRGD